MQKQTKPEPLGKSMAKLVLVVAIIVSLGAVLGVAGYLIITNPQVNPPVVITPPPAEEEIIITTDKTEYEQGEEIVWRLVNYKLGELYLLKESCNNTFTTGPELEKYKDKIWQEYYWWYNGTPNTIRKCFYTTHDCTRLKSDFNGIIKTKYSDSNTNILLEAGVYRIKITPGKSCEQKTKGRGELKNTFTIYSNEFTIKEKIQDETADLSFKALATEDWKTYRDEEYGFEFKYPSELALEAKKDEQASRKSISVFMKSSDFNGYILINNAGAGTGFGINVSSEDIKIDNVNTKLEILDSSVNNKRAIKVSFNKNNDEYFWLYRFDKEDSDKIELSKKIFSTFKFAEKDKTE